MRKNKIQGKMNVSQGLMIMEWNNILLSKAARLSERMKRNILLYEYFLFHCRFYLRLFHENCGSIYLYCTLCDKEHFDKNYVKRTMKKNPKIKFFVTQISEIIYYIVSWDIIQNVKRLITIEVDIKVRHSA